MKCPSCKTQQEDTELSCLVCGTLLAVTPEELARVERFRVGANTEMLTILFADISGYSQISSTSLSVSQKLLRLHHTVAKAIIERNQSGEIVNTAGDGILAVFANPAVATECALELQATAQRYNRSTLKTSYFVEELRAANIPLERQADESEYHIHIGLHLGLVTRIGETSRDVFGHHVNVAARLCSLAGAGQTYLSEAVFDNARLILGDRGGLAWQVWKEQPIKGLAEPMTIVGVAQQPFYTVTAPRMAQVAKVDTVAWMKKNNLVAMAALLAIMAIVVMLTTLHHPAPTANSSQAGVTAPGTAAPEDLAPLIATFSDLPVETTQTNGRASALNSETTAVTGTLMPPVAALGSATAINIVTPPAEGEKPTPNTYGKTTGDSDDAEFKQLPLEQLFTHASAITLTDGTEKIPAEVVASNTNKWIRLAIHINQHPEAKASLAILLDGDDDGTLRTQSIEPYYDLIVNLDSPITDEAKARFRRLTDGQPGDALPAMPELKARAACRNATSYWIVNLPYNAIGLKRQSFIRFRIEYRPTGKNGNAYAHPGGKEQTLRRLWIP